MFYPAYVVTVIALRFCGGALGLAGAIVLFYFIRRRTRQLPLWKLYGPPSSSFLTGNYRELYDPCNAAAFHEKLNTTYGGVIRITGTLGDSQLIISDPRACHHMLVKEQDVFEPDLWFREVTRVSFGDGLIVTIGSQHRKQRKLLNPVFSIKHMRSMTPLFQAITDKLRDIIDNKTAKGQQEFDLLDYFGRLALELIAQGGLGYSFGSLDRDDQATEYGLAMKEYIPLLSKLAVWRRFFPLISQIIPPSILRFAVDRLPFSTVRRLVASADIMNANAKKVFDEKKALLDKGDEKFASQVGEGKDIISILLKASLAATDDAQKLSDDEILAQMTTLIFAAVDTTSNALSRILYMLCVRQDIQDKLRDELCEARAACDGPLAYDELVALPYLEAVCRETLRLYAPVAFVNRTTLADSSVPLSRPLPTARGSVDTIFVPRDTTVLININGINRDPTIWGPDAAEWKPERWLSPLPSSVVDARIPGVYSNTLTFLGGGRACIGFKFSQLEMKVVLSELIPTFRFSLPKQEIVWRFGGIATPSVKGSTSLAPEMPMVVQRI